MRVELAFEPEAAELLRELVDAVATPAPPEPMPAPITPADLGLEVWTFHDPHQQTQVAAYIDDRGQLRHVPTNRTTEVPKAWRRVWLEPRD